MIALANNASLIISPLNKLIANYSKYIFNKDSPEKYKLKISTDKDSAIIAFGNGKTQRVVNKNILICIVVCINLT
jgi:hypothetical protein